MGECYLGGRLFNPEKVYELGAYLPYSEPAHLLTLAHTDNFVADSLSWGQGSLPISLQDYKTIDTETGSVLIDTLTSGACGYVDFRVGNKPVTIYAVMKITSGYSQYYLRHLSLMSAKKTGYGLITYGNSNSLYFGTFDNETAIPVNVTDFYVIGFNFDGSASYANVNGISCTKTISTISQYLTIGKTIYNNDNSFMYEYPSDVYVKFLSIIDTPESEEVIDNNILFLMNKYGIVV